MGFHSLLLPPPNITGALHLGHLGNITLQDFRYRWEEIRKSYNYGAIGVDHAGLSFQSKFDALHRAKKEILSKEDEERYLREMHNFAESQKERILSQLSLISSAVNSYQPRYTLEEKIQEEVIDRFSTLFFQGLIYKKKRLVNGDIKLQEVLADCEVIYRSFPSKLYYLKYQFSERELQGEYLVVATSRPETIFGDVALFIHPEDERYQKYLSKKVYIPGLKREIAVLADKAIHREFGSGVMKCTPAHDSLDGELKERHSLECLEIIDREGKLIECEEQFRGLDRLEAREKVVEWLNSLELVEKIEEYETSLSFSEKSNTLVEKLPTEQGFLSTSRLAKRAAEAIRIERLKLKIYPESQKEKLLNYLDNMEDGCLSRQILGGIRVPLIFDNKYQKYRILDKKVSSEDIQGEKEEIVLDTGFSSSLGPFLVFQGKEKERETFFPFSTLISGKDILLPGVARMLFLSLHLEGKFPFKQVFLHGLLRTKSGEKMSKSLDNGVMPEELYKKYSADVIRLAFLLSTNYDRDLRYSDTIFQKANLFLHKLKHIFTYLEKRLSKVEEKDIFKERIVYEFEPLNGAERGILREFSLVAEKLESLYLSFDYFELSREIIKLFSEKFSNRFLEFLKLSEPLSLNSLKFLAFLGKLSLRILYPFAPEFVLKRHEEIFSESLEPVGPNRFYPQVINTNQVRYDWFFQYLKEIRELYSVLGLDDSAKVELTIYSTGKAGDSEKLGLRSLRPYLEKLNHNLTFVQDFDEKKLLQQLKIPTIKIEKLYCECKFSSFSLDKYQSYVEKQLKKYEFELNRSKEIINRDGFRENASEELKREEKKKYREYLEMFKFYEALKIAISAEKSRKS